MVYTVRDMFLTPGLPPVEATSPPEEGTPLFKYVVDRLLASFDLPNLGFLKYYEWMQTPDGDMGLRPS